MNPELKDNFSLKEFKEYGSQSLEGGISSRFRNNPFTKMPMYLQKAEGSNFYDVTVKKYIDYFMGNGAILLGHKQPDIERALMDVIKSLLLSFR